ncbi:MAG: hypothetical protein M9915_16155 [Rhizobacter sp.]|nr:hypothetical protein [Rhizobacter sp.]
MPVDASDRALLLVPDILPTFSAAQFAEHGARLPAEAQRHDGLLALVELQNGDAARATSPARRNFYAITRQLVELLRDGGDRPRRGRQAPDRRRALKQIGPDRPTGHRRRVQFIGANAQSVALRVQ